MSRGQKNSLAKMMRCSPCCRKWNQLRLGPKAIPMYLHGFVPSCRRPFAEGRVSVGDHFGPPDFGPPQADEFSRPLDNKKGFPHPDLIFFTASPSDGEG